jgi:hypothetical protein
MNGNFLLNYLPPYKGTVTVIKKHQNTDDIIDGILTAHQKYAGDYSKISSFFLGSTPRQTCKNIWTFLKQNVNYKIESEDRQTIKSPAAIIATGKTTGSDCKNLSLMCAGILQDLSRKGLQKIPFVFRFSSYKLFNNVPEHVFIVAYPGTQKEIWIDAVLNEFDYKKNYTFKIDKKPMLVGIAGIGAVKKQTLLKKGAKVVLKVAGAPARTAFLLLVGLNFANLAVKLAAADQKDAAALKIWWEKLGGQIQKLLNQIKRGKTKKRIFGMDEQDFSIGLVDPATQTAVAAATPILVAVGTFLKSVGIDPEALKQIAADAANKKARQVVEKIATKVDKKMLLENQQAEEVEEPAKKFNYLPILLGAGVIVFLMMKKGKK